MEVNRKNFKETLPFIQESIEKADFLTIDTEFTGLMSGREVSIFDSPAEYYSRLYKGASDFLLIQYGLCCFYWDKEKKQYMNNSFNFYLFPRKPGPEKFFLCQSSSLDFLGAQGFDFNKVIKEGISYMTEPTETRLRDMLAERQKNYSVEKDLITIPEQHKQMINDICKKVRKFLDDNDSEVMEIDQCNGFVRRLLFQELSRFKKEAFVETKVLENQDRVLTVTRLKKGDDSKSRDNQKKEREWEELDDAVGFSRVARMISQSEKLVIGHNMLLDVLHSLSHFFQPLPEEYELFKEFTHCMFPRLLDTKYMSSLPPFKDKINSSVLQHLFITLSEKPFALVKAECEEGRGYTCTDNKNHEAGYDAYVTGLCFLSMYSHLSHMRGENKTRLADPNCPVLKPFLNKLFLAKTAHQDSPYMNLAGADPTPPRDHVFHMTFPAEWQRTDISQLFSAFGPITVQFLDDTSAIVALSRRDQARDVLRAFKVNTKVKLVPYATYKQVQTPVKQMPPQPARQPSPVKPVLSSDSRARQGYSTGTVDHSRRQTSERSSRVRCNSASASAAQSSGPPARKRTSSGVFTVDEAEPPIKKTDVAKSKSEVSRKKPEVLSNGRRKPMDSASSDKDNKVSVKPKQIEKPIVDHFDSDAKGNTVSAFEESDSWD